MKYKNIDEKIAKSILINNLKREYKNFSKYACKSRDGDRKELEIERVKDKENIRPSFFHDTDKIIHSKAYTRYIDKTQVFFLFENDHITHRVLHVQLVSKIGRVIGRCLRLNEDLIEAISLAHDLGHVPYGHDGEEFLNEIFEENQLGFFRHNAQGVRFLMEIENQGKGLNLTLQILDGILAHNGELLENEYAPFNNKKWDDFILEYYNCWKIKDFSKTITPMTLEGCVVRIADIIAYIGRDIEDAITVNLINKKDIPGEVKKKLGDNNSTIINTLTLDLINNSFNKNYLVFSKDIFKALEILKEFSKKNIYKNQKIIYQNDKIKNVFKTLFDKYLKDLKDENKESYIYKYYLNKMCDKYKNNNKYEIIVSDYIAGMTDDYINHEFMEIMMPKSFGYSL